MRQRLSRFEQSCKLVGIQLEFANAPILLPDGTRRWYTEEAGVDVAAAVDAAARLWVDGAPFDGLLGFSQDAAIVAAAAMAPAVFPGLRFAILAGAPDAPVDGNNVPAAVPSLHIIFA